MPKEFNESREEMERILQEETIGYLGLSMDGMPYVVPLNYSYVEGRILFHCALTGRKLDYLKANPRVCFTVGRQFGETVRHPQGALCHVNNDSVICYGTARMIENVVERRQILDVFNRCLRPDAEEITLEAAAKCCAVEIKVAEMTGRQQRDGKHTYWKYSFEQQGPGGKEHENRRV
jgi:nitroimidazol reductase NimA-like FMN-containing flavoprotein (pyridoxamine 5'-phosphate oxidase superfamily)